MQTRIAFISAAHIHTRDFIRHVRGRTDGVTAPVLWDDHPDRGRRLAAELGAAFEGNLEAVVARPDVDAFLICSENSQHVALLRKLLPLGKPIMCDKPLVVRPDDLAEVRQLLAAHPRTPVVVAYLHHFSAAMRTIEHLLREGALGRITRARYRSAHSAAYAGWFDPEDIAWFTDPAYAQGGAFMDMGSHAFHILIRLFGRPSRAWCHLANQVGKYPRVDDGGVGLLEFPEGVLGMVEANWVQTGEMNGLEVVGAKSSIWNTPQGYVWGTPGEAPKPLEPTQPAKPVQVARLVEVHRGQVAEEDWRADLAAALDVAAAVAACYESAKGGGRWTYVAYRD